MAVRRQGQQGGGGLLCAPLAQLFVQGVESPHLPLPGVPLRQQGPQRGGHGSKQEEPKKIPPPAAAREVRRSRLTPVLIGTCFDESL